MIYTDRPGDDPILFKFLSAKTELPWSTDLHVLGTLKKTAQGLVPSAAVGYNAWVEDGVFMHVAFDSSHGLTRELLREAFIHPFITCGKRVVYGMTPITNEEAIRFNKHLGFHELLRTSSFVLFQMTFEECRWLNGKKQRSADTRLH